MSEVATLTLTEFLLARIAEDEAGAINYAHFEIRDGIPGTYAIPERVLAECEAKRRIVGEHQRTRRSQEYTYIEGYIDPCITCGQVRPRKYPCATLRALALPYAAHPDYRKEWRP
jgi:hypothetical protein